MFNYVVNKQQTDSPCTTNRETKSYKSSTHLSSDMTLCIQFPAVMKALG